MAMRKPILVVSLTCPFCQGQLKALDKFKIKNKFNIIEKDTEQYKQLLEKLKKAGKIKDELPGVPSFINPYTLEIETGAKGEHALNDYLKRYIESVNKSREKSTEIIIKQKSKSLICNLDKPNKECIRTLKRTVEKMTSKEDKK